MQEFDNVLFSTLGISGKHWMKFICTCLNLILKTNSID